VREGGRRFFPLQRSEFVPHNPPVGRERVANTAEDSELQVRSHATLEKLCLAQWKWWPGFDGLHDHFLFSVVVRRKLNTTGVGRVVSQ
jgi:hypothetical protein